MKRPVSVVLAAHGSLASEGSNQPIHDLAKQVLESGRFDHVTPAFLNGDPLMTEVLDRLPSGEVVVVPIMTSQGYYLKKLPAKFSQNKRFDQFEIQIRPVIGIHPAISCLIQNRIEQLVLRHNLEAEQTTVVVVGHGTRRNPNSAASTIELVSSLEKNLLKLKFKIAFLDQDPEAKVVAADIESKNVIVIPFLVSRGPHMTEDVPEAFGLPVGDQLEFPLVRSI